MCDNKRFQLKRKCCSLVDTYEKLPEVLPPMLPETYQKVKERIEKGDFEDEEYERERYFDLVEIANVSEYLDRNWYKSDIYSYGFVLLKTLYKILIVNDNHQEKLQELHKNPTVKKMIDLGLKMMQLNLNERNINEVDEDFLKEI